MSKEESFLTQGTIVETVKNGFIVELESGATVLAYMAGKMRKYNIRLTLGDDVDVELTPYDTTKGRITKRN